MTSSNSTLYLAYGAYELKAAYQKNMILAEGLVILFTALIVGVSGLVMTKEAPLVIQPLKTADTVSAWILPTPTVILEKPEVQPINPARPVVEGGIPVPVDDDLLSDDLGQIPSQLELRALIGTGLDSDFGAGSVVVPGAAADAFPSPESLIILEIEPEFVLEVQPEYPRMARLAGISGTVWIRALVDKQGNVADAFVYRTSGSVVLDDAALGVAHQNKFKPGIQNGYPVKCWVSYRVKFVLTE
ncbi:MAG: TonB family protein [Candidatus Zixiibacteriota bacterium]